MPQWVKDNDEAYKQNQRLSHIRYQQYKQMGEIINELAQEKIAESLGWIV